jgi:hypothetical protein
MVVVTEAECNEDCTTADCADGLVCIDGMCRNPECTSEASCSCPSTVVEVTPTPEETVMPESGGPSPFLMISLLLIGAGLPLILVGLSIAWREQEDKV